jgi:hypothetical protein
VALDVDAAHRDEQVEPRDEPKGMLNCLIDIDHASAPPEVLLEEYDVRYPACSQRWS